MSFLASVAVLSAVYLVVARLERAPGAAVPASVLTASLSRHRPRVVRRRHRRDGGVRVRVPSRARPPWRSGRSAMRWPARPSFSSW